MIYYFGCWNGVGHHLWLSNGRQCDEVRAMLPWNQIDSDLAPGLRDRRDGYCAPSEQIEGRAALHHKDGWTALAWWDRSVDARHGSNSALIADETLTVAQMLEAGTKAFPRVMARLTFPIVVET